MANREPVAHDELADAAPADGLPDFLRSLARTVSFFAGELRRSRRLLAAFLLFAVAASAVQFLVPWLTGQLIDVVMPARDGRLLLLYAAGLVLAGAVSFLLNLLCIRFAVRLNQDVQAGVREKLLARLLAKRSAFFSRFTTGDLLTRLTADVDEVGSFFYSHVLYTAIFVIATLALAVWLLFLNPLLTFASFALFGLAAALVLASYAPVARRALRTRAAQSAYSDTAIDTIAGVADIRVCNRGAFFTDRFRAVYRTYQAAATAEQIRIDGTWSALQHLTRLGAAAPVAVGAFLAVRGDTTITTGIIIAFVQVLLYCSEYINYTCYALLNHSSATASLARLTALLETDTMPAGPAGDLTLTPAGAALELRRVAFARPAGRAVFRDLTLQFAAGEKVAVMAPSGCGKSTLAALVMRQEEPQAGEILFGGRAIPTYPRDFYLSFFGFVGPTTHLFKLSVRENLALGWAMADDTALCRLVATLRLADTVAALPDGLDTILGVGGLDLSTGQRQRLALGRALIREPQVLILDEFTSGLDAGTEQAILDDLLAAAAAQTVICLTHSERVAARMDRIVHLQQVDG